MAFRRHIGFIPEDHLGGVDENLEELVRLSYMIPGFGSYGVSCAGHFHPKWNEDEFYPTPSGHLGFAILPEMKHISELLQIVYDATQKNSDCRLNILKRKYGLALDSGNHYSPGLDLSKYSFGKTKDGLYVAVVKIRLGINSCFDSVPDYRGGPIKLKGNEEVFEKSRQRYEENQVFWKALEGKVRTYNSVHGFSECDFSKKEFLPFR